MRINRFKVRTIDIHAKEWFDRVNGNSYFSGHVVLNYGLKGRYNIDMPFQYGYGDSYIDAAKKAVLKHVTGFNGDERRAMWWICRENNIIVRATKKDNCRKKDL